MTSRPCVILQGRFADAEALCEGASHASAHRWGPDSLRSLWPRVLLARVYRLTSRSSDARDILEALLPVLERRLGPDYDEVLQAKLSLAQTLGDLGELGRAEQLHSRRGGAVSLSLGPTHRRTTDALRHWLNANGWLAGSWIRLALWPK